MLQQDYIMRLIRSFFEAMGKFLRNKGGKEPEILRKEVDDMYKTYLKLPRNHFNNLTTEEIISSFLEEERLFKSEIVAELLYQDAMLDNDFDELQLKKSLTLLKYVDLNSDTFSFDIQRKISEIESLLAG